MLSDFASWFYFNFVEVLDFDFYRYALFAAVLVSISTGIVSIVVVNKNWAMLGMGLSNSVFPGVVLGSLLHFPGALTLGAFISGLTCFALTNFLVKHTKLKNDAALGMCYSCFFALGLFLLSYVRTSQHISHILFGNLLGISDDAFIELILVALAAIGFAALRFRDMILFTFDEVQFSMCGLGLARFRNYMLILLTLVIIASLQAIGILLTISYLVLPAIFARQVTDKLNRLVWYAIGFNLVTSYVGLQVAFVTEFAVGPSIVVTQSLVYVIAHLVARVFARSQQQRLRFSL